MLEIAHQLVPRYSVLEVPVKKWAIDETGEIVETGETYKDYKSFSWQQAQVEMNKPNVKLIYLGADAIVGPELAPYWRENVNPKLIKLSTKTKVVPGSTRSLTKENRAAILKQYYNEVFAPLYQITGRWDLARNFIEHISTLIGLTEGKDFLPDVAWMQKFSQQYIQQMAEQQAAEGAGNAAV